ncbi:hypothetical protein A3A79_04025 [Candidatus Gottesmanbacteria bacterium RIFCSPLOWO2_01_FULL_43_11b]|uniref:DUF4446 domain-containing protein n=1 Tax=Candidatus Gottesmanbacteria bacterium RIFCSPLOWO2_01_FULL_43_11b TaxID=1798392 RepID=A0A1F6AHX2_9BACT|nr:MAG: hypothetical protein A3A79_04025 [Candidatus Gottesmanbacteria bacterium RIFCSPLOWO2_01_FULL_43_11b]
MDVGGGLFFWVIFVFISVWILILSVVLFRTLGHYNRLSHGVTKNGLKEVLEAILGSQYKQAKKINELEEVVRQVTSDGKRHIAKIGVVRFNPFADTGGSQSFTLAILDSFDNGVIMTSLFARNGNRWYVKEIRNGKGKDFELSKEEERAIKIAQPL